jgi:hypothetical protein
MLDIRLAMCGAGGPSRLGDGGAKELGPAVGDVAPSSLSEDPIRGEFGKEEAEASVTATPSGTGGVPTWSARTGVNRLVLGEG